ncbi:MAG TPA: T9SS type A sorting domain-containing protein [Bacteroidia bacterium]|nr:T9SS type A sorting domain-containing protein [Bacteroidia bacterium]
MKKITLSGLFLTLFGFCAHAQNGLEGIIVEKYYVSNSTDAGGSIGTLQTPSTTYRVFVDMLPNYKFQAAYGVPGHELRIQTSTKFFNNEDRGAITPAYSKTQAADNTVMLDSWVSVGAACTGNFGIIKAEDNGVSTVVNNDGLLMNNAGDPPAVSVQDGLIAGTPEAVTLVGFTTELDILDATSQMGNLISTFNGSWASLNGSIGPTSANKVLIGQFTTNGCFTFELNIQIGTPGGGVENYVARNPVGNEILLPGLTYNKASVSISANPPGAVCSGTNITFTATPVNGGAAPVYQWKKNGVNVGTNSPVYTSTVGNGIPVKCVMTSNASLCNTAAANSNTIIANVSPLPTATITTNGPTTYCSGTNALTLTANSDVGFTYKWKKGSAYVSGATNISYNPNSTGTYKVEVTNSNGCSKLSTTGVTATVNALPTATITPTGPTTFCSGTNPLTLTANSGTGLTYQWKKGTTVLSGATNISYVPTSTSTSYKVVVTNANGCSKTSANFSVTVNPLPTATVTPQGPTTFCVGESVVLQANSGAGLTYQWKKGANNISGATLQNYTATTAGSYKVVVTNANSCSKTSGTITVVVNCRTENLSSAEEGHQLLLYPNPAVGAFTLKISDSSIEDGVARLEITNAVGQNVFTGKAEFSGGTLTHEITPGSDWAKGIYFVKVYANGVTYNGKVMLQ